MGRIESAVSMTTSASPLTGLTVLDFSHALAGPYCSMLMAAYGARVIKIESPDGDIGRTWGPPFHGEDASYFVGLNSGKEPMRSALPSLNFARPLSTVRSTTWPQTVF